MRLKTNTTKRWATGSYRTIHDLPVELLDAAVGLLVDNPPTIAACSLVCRSWRNVARVYLFSTIQVSQNDSFADLPQQLLDNPGVAGCVKTLRLTCNPSTLIWDADVPRNYPVVDLEFLTALLPLLPRLQKLSMKGHLFQLPPPEDPRVVALTPLRLRSLVLHPEHCIIPALFTALSILRADTVEIGYCKYALDEEDPQAIELPRPLAIRTLSFGGGHGENDTRKLSSTEFCCWMSTLLCTALQGGTLETLTMPPTDIGRTGAFLRDCGRNLTRLDLNIEVGPDIPPLEEHPDHWRALNLHLCPRLTSMALKIAFPWVVGRCPMPRVPYGTVCAALLSTVSATALKELTLQIRDVRGVAQIRNPKLLGLRALDSTLANRFPNLQKVAVRLSYWQSGAIAPYAVECEVAVLKEMPKLVARGAVKMASWSPYGVY